MIIYSTKFYTCFVFYSKLIHGNELEFYFRGLECPKNQILFFNYVIISKNNTHTNYKIISKINFLFHILHSYFMSSYSE